MNGLSYSGFSGLTILCLLFANVLSAMANFWAYLKPSPHSHPIFNLCVVGLNLAAIGFVLYQVRKGKGKG